MTSAAILFEPDGYVLNGPKLMGRQAAGHAFLRAAVAGRGTQPVFAYTPFERSAALFANAVQAIDASAPPHWVPGDRLDLLGKIGTLYLPGPDLNTQARLRLRAGPGAYSLVGVTHTTASHGAMDSITSLLAAPVMPWDALICTSAAVVHTVQELLRAELDHLRWRFGSAVQPTLPQFPVIPLGVHCADYQLVEGERARARSALGIGPDEVVALFVGRLSFHAKAHPHAMYQGLQAAVARSGKSVVLLQSGWFANDAIEACFRGGAEQFCPDVRSMFADGRDPLARRQAWAAADLFVSLSDNIQETFGLTPIEAMAAGLPVVVTDWDGYKDTVREGVDGFRIPTWMPPPNVGETFARAHEAGVDNYDMYCGLTCQTVAVDGAVLADRLAALIGDAALRQRMGEAGRRQASAVYDWGVVYRQYQQLWEALADRRRAAVQAGDRLLRGAPACAPSRMDPYRSFGAYPSRLIQPDSLVALRPGADMGRFAGLAGHGLFNYATKVLPSADVVERIMGALADQPLSVNTLAARTTMMLGPLILALAVMAKMDLLVFSSDL
ncbi:glycosyltransferase [Duganella sp. FT94W]|uniref:Glycosyltransferase n=1 Tax=Duganella lactea TaxID=2692173 RepID=A0ABW9V7B7_9BURK|nr:glycosyltransferase family 4 protein [Duganella lactea]MYM35556.1 glycosyltransferase [Duganella lactea]